MNRATIARHFLASLLILVFSLAIARPAAADTVAALPPGVKAVWELDKAWQQSTPTRQRICVNGLWRWQPAQGAHDAPPTEGWGYFKVPGCWPGIDDYIQKDSQTVYPNPAWKNQKLRDVTAAWYQRQIEIPADWKGRRISLSADYVNSLALLYIDGKKAGEIHFPAGEVDLSSAVQAGRKHLLSLYVAALPMKGVMLSYKDSQAAQEVKGEVERRGLCGDVYLVGTPAGARLDEVKVETSVRKGEIAITSGLAAAPADGSFKLRARILDHGKEVAEFSSAALKWSDVIDGHVHFSSKWKPDRLWDLNTPDNQYIARVSLEDSAGKVIDTSFDVPFGYREFWIDGKDFYLNGSRIYLSAVPFDNASIGAGGANYAAARETMRRLKKLGINFVYTHNYDCTPGAHLSFDEILRAADDTGMLIAMTQPHFSNYDWKSPDADANYTRHAAFYARIAGSHPSVVFYAMSHNGTGYDGDMDPNLIDGIHDLRQPWSSNNMKLALRAEAIVEKLDPTRIVYHHAGGNIGSLHSINFYPNWAPIQELCDWFGHWSTTGVKPLFLCEYGAPFTWDWAMYRGWYKGKREFGSAAVPWEFCMAEWNAQFLGDRAFQISDMEKANLRWEAKQFRAGATWRRWDYPTEMGSPRFEDRHTVLGMYIADNWRAYRTWGVSGTSPWEFGFFFSRRDGADRSRKELPVDWENLQRPGLSPDYIADRVDRIDTAYEYADWIPTADGKALLANNQPVLAYIGGKADAFTEKGHNFLPGQTVEKQLILLNNSRQTVSFKCEWNLALPLALHREKTAEVATGDQLRIPLKFDLPASLPPGKYVLSASVHFDGNQSQSDTFTINVLPPPAPIKIGTRVALFDPAGETGAWLQKAGVAFQNAKADADLSAFDLLIVGKFALGIDGPAPDISKVRDGLKVVVFEQSRDVLEKRLGFRAEEYGLRNVFPRIGDHPILAGLDVDMLRDWRGEATTIPGKLTTELVSQHGLTVQWCDIPESRVWRAGTRGSVASVLIEKPARGDFRPILDGGFSQQFAPLMECRLGKGMILFCQMDVTGRSEPDPAADRLAANILQYASTFKPDPVRKAIYAGEAAGLKHLQTAGVDATAYAGGDLSPDQVLIIGPAADGVISPTVEVIRKFLAAGGKMLAIAIDQKQADAMLPFKVMIKSAEHINAVFDVQGLHSPLAGIGPADVYNRGPRVIPLLAGGEVTVMGDGVVGFKLSDTGNASVTFCQFAPWQVDPRDEPNLRRTFRRSSFLLTRLLANQGVAGDPLLLERFHTPVKPGQDEKRWATGMYLDQPEEWDDPYRFFRW